MQLRTYAKKNSLTAVDIIEVLKSRNAAIDWVVTSSLDASDIAHLNLIFGLSQSTLSASKEPLQLSASESDLRQLQPTQPTGELVEYLQAHSTNLTATDVEALHTNVQVSIIEERAEIAAYKDFQTYQTTYADTTRTLLVNDIYQKLDARNLARKQFDDAQTQLETQKPTSEKSSDLMSEMLGILKADKFKSSFLTSKLEQI